MVLARVLERVVGLVHLGEGEEVSAHLLGRDALGSGEPGALLPVYTRLSDAEVNERVRAGLAALQTPDSGVAGGEGL